MIAGKVTHESVIIVEMDRPSGPVYVTLIKSFEKKVFWHDMGGMAMNLSDGTKLTPMFYSEISSSFLIYQIFYDNPKIAQEFVRNFLNLELQSIDEIKREKMYAGKGAIDILLICTRNGRPIHVLIEVKVHDYLSATSGQILTYYEAARQDNSDVYFVYLTQFSTNNFAGNPDISMPPTIDEFKNAMRAIKHNDRIIHINWDEFHEFIDRFRDGLPEEQIMMLGLQKNWITAKSQSDITKNTINVGQRGIGDYFPDINLDITEELSFGETKAKNKRRIFSVNVSSLNEQEYDKVLMVIGRFLDSSSVDKTVIRKTEEYTLAAARDYLSSLAQDEMNWKILSFYASLFHMINTSSYVFFNGTGSRGFSIKVRIKAKGEISLCTLWANKTIEFSLMR